MWPVETKSVVGVCIPILQSYQCKLPSRIWSKTTTLKKTFTHTQPLRITFFGKTNANLHTSAWEDSEYVLKLLCM